MTLFRRFRWSASSSSTFLAIVICLSGCDRKGSDDLEAVRMALGATDFVFSIPLPGQVDMASVVISASNSLNIATRVQIEAESSAAPRPLVASLATSTTTIGADAVVSAEVQSKGSVFLATRSQVAGSITTAGTVTRQSGAVVGGAVRENMPIVPRTVSWGVTFPASTTNVTLQPGQSHTLSPGAFVSVNVNSNATLTLRSGTYYLDSLSLQPTGKIVLDGAGPFTVYVRSQLALKGVIQGNTAASSPRFIVGFAGQSDVVVESRIGGMMVAPNARIILADIGSQVHDGAFFARDLETQTAVRIRHRPATAPVEVLSIPSTGGRIRCSVNEPSVLTLGETGVPLQEGVLDLTLKPSGAISVNTFRARSSAICQGASCSPVVLQSSASAPSTGTLGLTDGRLTANFAIGFIFEAASPQIVPLTLSFVGGLQRRKISGYATGTIPASAPMFSGAVATLNLVCSEVEPDQLVEMTIQMASAGTMTASNVLVRPGTPPNIRPNGGDLTLEALDEIGMVVDRVAFPDPRVRLDAAPLATASAVLQVPFANGVRSAVVRGASGQVLTTVSIAPAIAPFCNQRPTNPECTRLATGQVANTTILQLTPVFERMPNLEEIHVAAPAGERGQYPGDLMPAVAMLPSGVSMVVWYRDRPEKADVRVRLFDAGGLPLRPDEGLVPQGTWASGRQDVAGSATGFAVVSEQTLLSNLTTTIVLDRFDFTGNRLTSTVIKTSTPTTGVSSPAVAMDGAGRILVAWLETQTTGQTRAVLRRFVNTVPDGSEITLTNAAQSTPLLAADNIGRFAVVFEEPTGTIGVTNSWMQRFNQNRAAVGPRVSMQAVARPGSLAIAPDTGVIAIAKGDVGSGPSSTGQSLSISTWNPDGVAQLSRVRMDAKNVGSQTRPAIAVLPNGEFIGTWEDNRTPSASTGQVNISAQLFDSSMFPLDIDFDLGTVPVRPLGDQGGAPTPRAAAGGGRYAVVWESATGVRMRIINGGSYPCPNTAAGCGAAKPLLISGDPKDTFDVVFVNGQDATSVPTLSESEFARHAVNRIVNGPFAEVGNHRGKFNVLVFFGHRLNFDALPPERTPSCDLRAVAWSKGSGEAVGNDFVYAYPKLGVFRHEWGHGGFGLSDEYLCDGRTRHFQPTLHANLFPSEASCRSGSVTPGQCRSIGIAPGVNSCGDDPEGDGWWKSDPENDVMQTSGGGDQDPYGPDCAKRIRVLMDRLPCPTPDGGTTGTANCL